VTNWAELVAATPVAQLLPARHAWSAGAGGAELIDMLPCDAGAVLIVQVADERIVVPTRSHSAPLERAPLARAALASDSAGSFGVQRFAPLPVSDDESVIDVDQTNDSLILGTWVVKWQVRVQPSPALDRLRAIQQAVASGVIPDEAITPALLGSIEWTDGADERFPILTAQELLPESEDGWTWAVELLRSHARGEAVDAVAPFARLGRMTGLMHVAFAADGIGTWDRSEIAQLHASAREDLVVALELVDGAEGARLRARADRIASGIDALADVDRTPVIAVHGDLHVGQVLRTPDGELAIVDFDGSPVQTPTERLLPQPAARDVAGMLASIDHVARVVNYRTPDIDAGQTAAWIPTAQGAYLDAYLATLAEFDRASIFDERLVRPFLLHQECREFIYAVRHLPHWRYVPDAVLTAMFAEES
jgi:maltokinase